MVAERFQIYDAKITGNYICESKNSICSFLLIPQSKTLPQVIIITPPPPTQKGNFHSSRTTFSGDLFFPEQKGGGGGGGGWALGGGGDQGVEKGIKINLVRVLVTSSDKSHHL